MLVLFYSTRSIYRYVLHCILPSNLTDIIDPQKFRCLSSWILAILDNLHNFYVENIVKTTICPITYICSWTQNNNYKQLYNCYLELSNVRMNIIPIVVGILKFAKKIIRMIIIWDHLSDFGMCSVEIVSKNAREITEL